MTADRTSQRLQLGEVVTTDHTDVTDDTDKKTLGAKVVRGSGVEVAF